MEAHIGKKVKFEVDETNNVKSSMLEEDDVFPNFYRDLFNNYLEYYNKLYGYKNKTLFHGIVTSDKSSTNKQLEQLYSEMHKYGEYKKINSDLIKIVPYGKINELNINDDFETYCILKDTVPYLVSQSFFALIKELTDLKNEDGKHIYEIIILE